MLMSPLCVVASRWRGACVSSKVRLPSSVLVMATSPGEPVIETVALRLVIRRLMPLLLIGTARRSRSASCLLHAVDRRLGVLAEVLHPCALDAGVVLGRLDQVHKAGDRHLEASPKLLVGDLTVVECEVGARE